MTDTQELRRRIEEAGLKYKYIAQKLGVSAYTLQKKINNDSEFRVSEVDQLSTILGLSPKEKIAIFFAA